MKKVAIQGVEGSFHHAAAQKYLGRELEIIPCTTFKELVHKVESRQADLGVMAVENTIAGSLLPNYRLLLDTSLNLTGEIYLRIRQNLVALPGQALADIRAVHSHPIALEQCREFFQCWPDIRLVESEDTALSARQISERRDHGITAIASKAAAELYGLEILARGIETNKTNYTRFWVVSEKQNPPGDVINKASLSFSLKHQTGQLARVLTLISGEQVNLTKIQSIPVIGKAWEYHFFVDLVFDEYAWFIQALQAVEPWVHGLRVLGQYSEGEKTPA